MSNEIKKGEIVEFKKPEKKEAKKPPKGAMPLEDLRRMLKKLPKGKLIDNVIDYAKRQNVADARVNKMQAVYGELFAVARHAAQAVEAVNTTGFNWCAVCARRHPDKSHLTPAYGDDHGHCKACVWREKVLPVNFAPIPTTMERCETGEEILEANAPEKGPEQ